MKKLVFLLCFALLAVSKASADGFVDNNGVFTIISGPGLGSQIQALAVNGLGQVVGTDAAGAFIFSNGTLTQLNLPGMIPSGINNAGAIVFDAPNIGFLDVGGTLTPLAFPGAIYSEPTAIANNGVVVGVYELPGSANLQSWVYSGGTFTALNAPGAIDTRVFGVNDQGEMVGASFNGTTVTNFLYNNGQFTNIGVEGLGINGLGQIVGDVGGLGFVGDGVHFTTFSVPGATSTAAKGINDEGEIVGVATFPLPVPEPGTLMLLVCGIGVLGLLGTFYRNFRMRES